MKQLKKASVGGLTDLYKSVITDTHAYTDKQLEYLNRPFIAYSVVNAYGQIAIFPCDDFGDEQAKKNAELFCKAYNDSI
jgi:hypothetical protein